MVGNFPPNVWANWGSGVYVDSLTVELFAEDKNDDCPLIYYTCDGSLPTTSSNLYSSPIYVSNSSNCTIIRFFAIDKYGAKSDIVSIYYFFGDIAANINGGIGFGSIQELIDDNLTVESDLIEISSGIEEYFVLNKSLNLKKDNFEVIGDNLSNLNYFFNCSNSKISFSSGLNNSIVYCSFDNGSSWWDGEKNISFNLCEGNWSILYYCSVDGVNGTVHKLNFLFDCTAPLVWANYGSSIYNESLFVNLSAWDYADVCPLIYYACDGSLPTADSNLYSGPIYISNSSNCTNLRFFGIDNVGHRSKIVSIFNFFGNFIANLNSGKSYISVQEAIDDNDTKVGDVIELSCDLGESLLLNKGVYLRACGFKPISWNSSDCAIVINANGSIIEGFDFVSYAGINLNGASDTFILNNSFNCIYADIFNYNSFVGGNNLTILSSNNLFSDNTFVGYKILGSIYLNSYNSTFVRNYFNLSGNSSAVNLFSTYSLICDNEFYNCNYGLNIYGFNFTVSNNTFINTHYGIYFIDLFNETLVGDVNGVYINSLYSWSYGACSNDIVSNIFLNNDYAIFAESANLFLGFGGLFVVEGADVAGTLAGLGTLVEGLGVASLGTACLIVLPVLFLSIEPVGEPDAYVDNYWDNYRSIENSESMSGIHNDVQIKKRNDVDDNYDLYRNISRELNFFSLGKCCSSRR